MASGSDSSSALAGSGVAVSAEGPARHEARCAFRGDVRGPSSVAGHRLRRTRLRTCVSFCLPSSSVLGSILRQSAGCQLGPRPLDELDEDADGDRHDPACGVVGEDRGDDHPSDRCGEERPRRRAHHPAITKSRHRAFTAVLPEPRVAPAMSASAGRPWRWLAGRRSRTACWPLRRRAPARRACRSRRRSDDDRLSTPHGCTYPLGYHLASEPHTPGGRVRSLSTRWCPVVPPTEEGRSPWNCQTRPSRTYASGSTA